MTDRSDTEHSDLAPESAVGETTVEPGGDALAMFALNLEEKVLRHLQTQLERHHEQQLKAIRQGQSESLKHYQNEWAGHTQQLSDAISEAVDKFDAEFGRAIMDLQQLTHATNNLVTKHELRLDEHAGYHELHSKRLGKIETLQSELSEFRSKTLERLNKLEEDFRRAAETNADTTAGG